MNYLKEGDKVVIWMDCENGQRLGTPGEVIAVFEWKVTVRLWILGEWVIRDYSEGQIRTNITKFEV